MTLGTTIKLKQLLLYSKAGEDREPVNPEPNMDEEGKKVITAQITNKCYHLTEASIAARYFSWIYLLSTCRVKSVFRTQLILVPIA